MQKCRNVLYISYETHFSIRKQGSKRNDERFEKVYKADTKELAQVALDNLCESGKTNILRKQNPGFETGMN